MEEAKKASQMAEETKVEEVQPHKDNFSFGKAMLIIFIAFVVYLFRQEFIYAGKELWTTLQEKMKQ